MVEHQDGEKGETRVREEIEASYQADLSMEDGEEESEENSEKNSEDLEFEEDIHWSKGNFRCEASVSVVRELDGSERTEQIVEFWPIHQIEPRSGVEVTWGEQYVYCSLSILL